MIEALIVVGFTAAILGLAISVALWITRSNLSDQPPIMYRAPTDDDWRRWHQIRAKEIRLLVLLRRSLVIGGLILGMFGALYQAIRP